MIPVDDYVRRLPLPTDEQAAALDPGRQPWTLAHVLTEAPPSARKSRRRRPLIVVGVAVAAASTVGAAWFWLPPRAGEIFAYSNWVNCHIAADEEVDTEVVEVERGQSSDPVVACSNEWRRVTGRLTATAPAMRTYDNGDDTLEVLAADAPVPTGWEAIDPGPFLDPRWEELYQAIPDPLDGITSACLSTEEATDVAANEIERIGLTGWVVRHIGPEADGSSTCAFGGIDLPSLEVRLDSRPGPEPFWGTDPRWRELRVRLTQACGTTEEAAALARDVWGDAPLVVVEIPDPAKPCATVELEIGGDVPFAIVRGPSSLMP